ncbi:MAG: monovalent cation/H+ antiporter complex subunit F [Alphaproteobacteria bacterium]
MFAAAALAIIVTMGLALIRAFIGPTLYDRILAVNMFGTKTVLIIAVLGFLMGRPDFLDIALVYALINFIGVIALLKYFKYGNLSIGPGEENDANRSADRDKP